MRKALLTLALTALLAPVAIALPVQISPSNSITVLGGYTQTSPLAARFTITNTGGGTLALGLQRQVIQNVAGSQNNFCFGTGCYPPSVSISPQPITLAAGASDNTFLGDYEPQGNAGIAIIRYAIYDTDGSGSAADTVYVTVTYDASRPNGLAEDLAQSTLLPDLYPNPAVGGAAVELTIEKNDLTQNGAVQLISLADGRVVRRLDFRPGFRAGTLAPGERPDESTFRVSLPTRELSPGLYACTLVDATGRPRALRRLVIQ